MVHEHKKFMDMSLGDPLESFDFLARDAFERAMKCNHQYSMMGGDEHLKDLYKPVQDYLEARGFKSAGWRGIPNCDLLFTGGGTTQAFSMIMRYLGDDVKKQNKRLPDDGKIKPVILMPTPTYGMFFNQPRKEGIEVVHIPREMKNGGALNPAMVVDTVEALHADGKRIIAYYDSNPHNPLGLIRGEEETRKLAGIFNHYSDQYWQDDRAYLRAEREQPELDFGEFLGVRMNHRHPWDGPAARIRFIDDMVYWGLEYDGAEQPFSFARVDEQSQKNSFVLCGPSKAGMASVRAGLIYAEGNDVRELQCVMHDSNYFPPLYAMEAMSGYFNDEQPYQVMREKHLKSLNDQHEFSGKFMKALINGGEALVGTTVGARKKMANLIATHKGMSTEQAREHLKKGVDGVRVITSPQAGFFHMLDFSELKDRYFDNEEVSEEYKIKSELQIGRLMRSFNVSFAAGDWTGLEAEDMFKRATFALPPADIIEFVDRLKQMVAMTMTEKEVAANGYNLKRTP